MILANAAAWREPLPRPDAARRPRPDKWSPLEYGCHVRDVLRLYDYRLGLMLTEDDPLYPNWDQDETAIADRYDTQDPATVAAELAAAAEAMAARFARRRRRPVGAPWPAQRRRRLHGGDVRPVLHARPGPPPARRHRAHRTRAGASIGGTPAGRPAATGAGRPAAGSAASSEVGLPLRVAVELGADEAPVRSFRYGGGNGKGPAEFG